MNDGTPLETLHPGRAATMRALEAQRRRLDHLTGSLAAVLDHIAELPPTALVDVATLRALIGWPLPNDGEDGG